MIQNSSTTPPNEDSLCKPIIQLMSTMNQQQMRVRKPSEETKKKQQTDIHQIKITNPKSPTLTQVSAQLASDRQSPNQYRDLLLISEEPSNKEDSQQYSVIKKQNDSDLLYRKSNFHKSSNSSFTLLYRERNSLISKLILTKQQFTIINDLSAQYFIPFKQQIIQTIKQETIKKQFILGIYYLFLLFYLTILLIEIACDQVKISNQLTFHFILFIVQILDSSYYLLVHQFQLSNFIFDILNLIPFFANFIADQHSQKILYLIYLIRIKKINKYIFRLNYYFNHYDYLFIIQTTVQFHFATFIAQTFIFLFTTQKQDFIDFFENLFTILIKSPNIISKYLFIIYLVKIFLLIFYIYQLKLILNYNQSTKDQIINYTPQTQKQIIKVKAQQKLFNINDLPQCLQNQMKREKYLQILQTIPIFQKSFSKQTLLNICDVIQEKILKPNQILHQQQALCIHLEGEIEIIQVCEQSLKQFKLALIKDRFQIFNNTAFFKNQMQGLQFESKSHSKLAYLDPILFYQLIKKCPREFQKYRMLIDTIIIDNEPCLAKITCLSCQQAHDITQCPYLNYKPNKLIILRGYNCHKIQKRVMDFKRTQRKKRNIYYKIGSNKEDSESFDSEEQDKVEPFDKILPSQNSSVSLQNNNNFNQLELSSVPYVNYSHSGQTLYSKKQYDSENFLSVQGVSSSNSSRKIIFNELKEIGQSKFQKFGQAEEQNGSSFQYNPLAKVQDSLIQAKNKQHRGSLKQQQFQRFQTDLPQQQQQQTRDQRKNQTVVSFENSNYQRVVSIEDNMLQSFDKISRFDDYFPHYNVDQQINNYQKIQSIQNKDSNQ